MRIVAGKNAIVAGDVPRDAEVRTTATGKDVCNFSIKASETENADGTKTANWLNCVAWRKACDVARYIVKGDSVLCAGELQERSYTTRDGDEKKVTELVCDYVMVMQPPGDVPLFVSAGTTPTQQSATTAGMEECELDDDDLPF